jgi:hypothetical protein
MTFKNLTLYVKKSNSSNETPNVMTVGVENYGLIPSSSARNSDVYLYIAISI